MKVSRFIQILLTVLPVLTAGLYLLGLAYHQGYLFPFGLNESLFPLPSDKALSMGFYSLVVITFPAGIYAIGTIGAFVVLLVLAIVLSSKPRVAAIGMYIRAKITRNQSTQIPGAAERFIDLGEVACGYIVGLCISLLLVLIMAALAERSGKEQGQREIEVFANGEGSRVTVYTADIPRGLASKLVACSEIYCAFWSGINTTVLRHDLINRMVTYRAVSVGSTTPHRSVNP